MSKAFKYILFVGSSVLAAPAWAEVPAAENQDAPTESEAAIAGGEADGKLANLLDMPLEDLLTIEATSVAKKRQRVSDSSAAVFVITQDDIRRSSASTVSELLRMVPGMEVAKIQNSAAGVTARGFNGLFANSLLVMVDGRAIYFSSLAGVFWNQQLLPLSDIERIEVVRGPGATLWGSNAVNGVVNIISKHSGATLGANVDVRLGNREQSASLSYSGRLGEDGGYRVYGTYLRDLELTDAQGASLGEPTQSVALGARIDFEPTDVDAITVQTDFAHGTYQRPEFNIRSDLLSPGYDRSDGDSSFSDISVLGRWAHSPHSDLDVSAQAYYSGNSAQIQRMDGQQHLIDLDLGVRWRANSTHELNFGLGWRQSRSHITGPPSFTFQQDDFSDRWLSGYLQDDITLVPETLHLTLGTKLEQNNFTGFEFQPSLRVLFKPAPQLSLWGSVARAVRTPSLIERSGDFRSSVSLPGTVENPSPLPVYSHVLGNPNQQSVRLTAYEIGLRSPIAEGWSIDINSYYNVYDRVSAPSLVSITPLFQAPESFLTDPPTPLGLEANLVFGNAVHIETWGVEAYLSGHLTDWWKLDLSFSHMAELDGKDSHSLLGSPEVQFGLRSAVDIGDNLSIDGFFRHVGALRDGATPANSNLDLRITYRPAVNLELSLVGKDILTEQHLEYGLPDYPAPINYVPRSVSVQARARF